MGRLIPAGTGIQKYRDFDAVCDEGIDEKAVSAEF